MYASTYVSIVDTDPHQFAGYGSAIKIYPDPDSTRNSGVFELTTLK
jgi:hypothetical protein